MEESKNEHDKESQAPVRECGSEVHKVSILALDPKTTHEDNPDCPSRLVRAPNDHWMCIDCGFQIIERRVECIVKDD